MESDIDTPCGWLMGNSPREHVEHIKSVVDRQLTANELFELEAGDVAMMDQMVPEVVRIFAACGLDLHKDWLSIVMALTLAHHWLKGVYDDLEPGEQLHLVGMDGVAVPCEGEDILANIFAAVVAAGKSAPVPPLPELE